MNKDDRVKKNGMLGQLESGFYRLDYFTTILLLLLYAKAHANRPSGVLRDRTQGLLFAPIESAASAGKWLTSVTESIA